MAPVRLHHRAWPTKKEQHEHMRLRQEQRRNSGLSKGELWVYEHLINITNLNWIIESQWGFNLFDFWNSKLGINVEADDISHSYPTCIERDKVRDHMLMEISGIVVIRVNYYNELEMQKAVDIIRLSNTWLERRSKLGLLTKAQKKA